MFAAAAEKYNTPT